MTNADAWAEQIGAFQTAMRAAGRSPATMRLRLHYVSRMGAHVRPLGPFDVGTDDIRDWLGSQAWKRETLRSAVGSARAFYSWAHKAGRIAADPGAGLDKVRESPPAPRPVSDTDYAAALLAATPAERIMVRLAAENGLRRAEVAQVHAQDLVEDLDGFSLVVHGKGARERTIPLADDLAVLVRGLCAGGYAFPGRFGGHAHPDFVGRRVSALLPAGVSMHKLRHRFATRAYAVDTDLLNVQALLGHASTGTTRRYVALPKAGLRRTVLAAAG